MARLYTCPNCNVSDEECNSNFNKDFNYYYCGDCKDSTGKVFILYPEESKKPVKNRYDSYTEKKKKK